MQPDGLSFQSATSPQLMLRDLSLEIVRSLDRCQKPKLWDPSWGRDFEARIALLQRQIREFIEHFSVQVGPRATERLKKLEAGFEAYRLSLASSAPSLAELKLKYQGLCHEYEAILTELRKTGFRSWVGSGHLKPVNYWRNLFHATNATIAFVLYQWFLTREQALWILGALAVPAVALEFLRKVSPRLNDFLVDRVFTLIARPKERHTVNSATWYTISLVLTCALFPEPAVLLAVLILGYSDPIASIVGKRWGSIKVRGQKSLQGTIAFALSAVLLACGYAWVSGLQLSGLATLVWCLGVPLSATLAELYGDRVDDNFGILLAAGGAAALALSLV